MAHQLYGVRIEERQDVDVYHPDVRFYDILGTDGAPRGGFFLDLYARPKKRGGAWMDECLGRIDIAGAQALPVAYLVCNFTPPGGDRPSLLTHYEVVTLFHEFGHGLHHMLTRVDFPSVAGINGVPWDAVELPSQFMENFAWREEVLPLISGHVETGAPLPLDALRKLQATRSFQAGMQSVRQLEFALFDFRLHAEFEPGARRAPAADPGGGARRSRRGAPARVQPLPAQLPAHLLGRLRRGLLQLQVGRGAVGGCVRRVRGSRHLRRRDRRVAFCGAILERGGSRDAMEAFVEFRGRKPELEPLLRQLGLAA